MNGSMGDYGLPAAARYGTGGPTVPGRPGVPFLAPDSGIGNTTSESTTTTTPSVTSDEIMTPHHVPGHLHVCDIAQIRNHAD